MRHTCYSLLQKIVRRSLATLSSQPHPLNPILSGEIHMRKWPCKALVVFNVVFGVNT
jgi:hypothetical protein